MPTPLINPLFESKKNRIPGESEWVEMKKRGQDFAFFFRKT
jgi:hypothetical protein